MKVELNDESLPKGTEMHVEGLGTLVNGKEVEFDDVALASFEERTGQTLADAFKNDSRVKLSGAGSRTTSEDTASKEKGGES